MRSKSISFLFVILTLLLMTAQPALAASGPTLAPLLAVDSTTALPDRYIVVFKDGIPREAVDAALAVLTHQGGAAIHFRYKNALSGFAATLPAQTLAILQANPDVAYVEADQTVKIDTTQTGAPWGLDRIDQRSLPLSGTYAYNNTGAGVIAYIIDTGIRITHTEFGGRASVGTDTVGDGQNGNDCNGHGTHVAGTVGGSTYGVAKGVRLIAVRVLDCSGTGTTSSLIAGIDWVTANHQAGQPAVANMSVGGSASKSLDKAVTKSIADGVTYVVAAGNDGVKACLKSPARVRAAITVGATDSSDTRPFWSNYGACLDIFAPGVNITSAWDTSDTATNTLSGTSMATPHVTGVAALYLESNPTASPAMVRNALVSLASTGVVKNPGRKSPNKMLFTNY